MSAYAGADRSFDIPEDFDYTQSTEDNYALTDQSKPVFVGEYANLRSQLDYDYHTFYNEERQLLHDSLINIFHDTIVVDTDNNLTCDHPLENWMVFTAGAMGAGKGFTMKYLASQGLFPKDAFVQVDPDALRELLPETNEYVKIDPTTAGYLTQKEVGFIAETLTLDALSDGKNVLVDGSLRNAEWYANYIQDLHNKFPKMKFAIIHVTAKPETVFERALKRGLTTGRVVPRQVLIDTMVQIPKSLRRLAPFVDFVATFANEDNVTEPVLLWLSRRPTSSSTDLTQFAEYGHSESLVSLNSMDKEDDGGIKFRDSTGSMNENGYNIASGLTFDELEPDVDIEDILEAEQTAEKHFQEERQNLSERILNSNEEKDTTKIKRTSVMSLEEGKTHRVTYNIEGRGRRLSTQMMEGKVAPDAYSPSDEWKESFKALWKMHCPFPPRRLKSIKREMKNAKREEDDDEEEEEEASLTGNVKVGEL